MQIINRLQLCTGVLAAVMLCACSTLGVRADAPREKVQDSGVPTIVFNNTKHDFGTVQYKGGGLTHEFVFKNTGTAALLIKNVKAG